MEGGPRQVEHTEALDQNIYEKFKEIGSFQAYEYFEDAKKSRDADKALFLASREGNPTLQYPKLNLEKLTEQEAWLKALRKEVGAHPDALVKQVYVWRINEKLAENRLLQAAAKGDMKYFARYSKFVYGEPSPDVFRYTVQRIRAAVEKTRQSDQESQDPIHVAAGAVLALLPETPTVSFAALPSEETIQRATERTQKDVGDLLLLPEGMDRSADLQATDIQALFSQALNKVQGERQGEWKVVIDNTSSKTGISVSQEKQEVQIPATRTAKAKAVQALVAHEIGTHVARRVNGERSKLRLLALGLDRYEGGEEGIATLREQVVKGKVDDFSGDMGHLAIGLAKGIDSHARDFRETYDVLYAYAYWNQLRLGTSAEDAKKKAQDTAWNRCVRTFRGTDGNTPGVCFTKDIIYREGNIGVWDVVEKTPDELMRFQVGKYDPGNPRHIWVLEQLGITTKDLAEAASAETSL